MLHILLPENKRLITNKMTIDPKAPVRTVLIKLVPKCMLSSPSNQYPIALPRIPTIIFPNNPKPLPEKITLPSHPANAPIKSMITISMAHQLFEITLIDQDTKCPGSSKTLFKG